MDQIKQMFQKGSMQKLAVVAVLGIILYFVRDLFNMILLTFLFAYIIESVHMFVVKQVRKFMPIKDGIVIVLIYVLLIVTLVLVLYKYIPIAITQGTSMVKQIAKIDIKQTFGDNAVSNYAVEAIKNLDLQSYTTSAFDYSITFAKNVGTWSLNLFLAIVLSLFFVTEKTSIKKFLDKVDDSKIGIGWIYLKSIGRNFLNSFGKVIQAQLIIASVNAVLSAIALTAFGFPDVLVLGIMIFVLGLVPVAGVIISLIPLCMIAFQIGGVNKIIWVLAMVAILHALESYVLNPKLMSEKTKLPVFFTFMILIVAEHFMGTWGLLLGIPLFMFIMDLLGVKTQD